MNWKNFNAIVCTDNLKSPKVKFIAYHKQTSKARFINFINQQFPSWPFFTAYDRDTKEKELIKNNSR